MILAPITFTSAPSATLEDLPSIGGTFEIAESGPFIEGQEIHVSARWSPAFAGSAFLGWAGNVVGTNETLTVTMGANTRIRPLFGAQATVVTIGGGTIRGIANGTLVPYESVLELDAVPAEGSFFAQWGGSASGTNSHLVMTNAGPNLVITAVFSPPPKRW